MTNIHRIGAQGDLLFLLVDQVPPQAKRIAQGKQQIVGHSETGHHHRAVAEIRELSWYADPENELEHYLEIAEPVEVHHERDYDTHATVQLLGQIDRMLDEAHHAVYRVIQQREMTPQGWGKIED